MFSMYQQGQLKITNLIRLGLLEWLEKPLIIKTPSATILCVQPEMKFRGPPGQFHHEPPLTGTYTLDVRRGPNQTDSDVTCFRSCDQRKIAKKELKDNQG